MCVRVLKRRLIYESARISEAKAVISQKEENKNNKKRVYRRVRFLFLPIDQWRTSILMCSPAIELRAYTAILLRVCLWGIVFFFLVFLFTFFYFPSLSISRSFSFSNRYLFDGP